MSIGSLLPPASELTQQIVDERPTFRVVARRVQEQKRAAAHVTTPDAAGIVASWIVDLSDALASVASPLTDPANVTRIDVATTTEGRPAIPNLGDTSVVVAQPAEKGELVSTPIRVDTLTSSLNAIAATWNLSRALSDFGEPSLLVGCLRAALARGVDLYVAQQLVANAEAAADLAAASALFDGPFDPRILAGPLDGLLSVDLQALSLAGVRAVLDQNLTQPVIYDPRGVIVCLWTVVEDAKPNPAQVGSEVEHLRYVSMAVTPGAAAKIGT